VKLEELASLDEQWQGDEAHPVLRLRSPGGARAMDADRDPKGRWRVHQHGVAVCVVEADGSSLVCAPSDPDSPRWTRFLVGQGLPLAAVLQGLEPFHASAGGLAGATVGITGASYAGKTTLALALVLRGAALVTDDVLVVEASGDSVAAHPGAHIANVRHATVELFRDGGLAGIGAEVSRDEHGVRLAVELERAVQPLSVLYYLERSLGQKAPAFERLRSPDPRLLLAASFNLAVVAPDRLARQLDVCWRIARTTSVVRALMPPGLNPREMAAAVECDARTRQSAERG